MSSQSPLLTAHIFTSFNPHYKKIVELTKKLEQRHITARYYKPQDPITTDPKKPRVYMSLGENWDEFTTLNKLPVHERRRWVHYDSVDNVDPGNLFYCWLHASEPLRENKKIPLTRFSSEEPLVSIFTAAYRSGEKIHRPYQSLLNQTYSNWEWVIVDDSGDNDETYHQSLSTLQDPRVSRYRQDSQSGYIGAIKRYAAGLCTGEILVEVDHDDELTPDCLEKIVDAFKNNPSCGFAFGEGAELHWGSNAEHSYGWDFAYGYGLYYRVWVHSMNRWQNVARTANLNWQTIRHLVGLPNHPRAWTRECYHLLGGHRPELFVADDYDLLVRSFLCTNYIRIPHLLYLQYRNDGGDNSTFIRNQQIQTLCKELENYYKERINRRTQELDLPSLQHVEYKKIWEVSKDDPRLERADHIEAHPSRTSFLFPIPHTPEPPDYTELFQVLQKGIETQFKDFEVVIVGNIPLEIEEFASRAPTGAIRWWPMEENHTMNDCVRYAKLCVSCSKTEVILPE